LESTFTDTKEGRFWQRALISTTYAILSWLEYPLFQKSLQAVDSNQRLVKIAKPATMWTGGGSGLVIARYKKDEYTVLDFIPIESFPRDSLRSDQVKYAIASHFWPDTYLRLDGAELFAKKKTSDRGEGTVNCQPAPLGWEFFNIIPDSTVSGKVNIQSAVFPGVFLRMDASRVTEDRPDGDAGSINAQWSAGSLERFEIV
jgi:hypothetical protein